MDWIARARDYVDIGIGAVENIEDHLIRKRDAAYLYRDGKIDARALEDLQAKSGALLALNAVVALGQRIPGSLGVWFTEALRGVTQAGELLYGRVVLREIAYKDMYAAITEYRKENSYSVGLHTNKVIFARDPNELLVSPEGDVMPGDKLNYAINYENEGDGDAYGVYITDTLEEDLDNSTLVVNDGGKYNPATRTITWFIGELLSKQKGSVTFSVNVNKDAPDKTEVINFATVYFPSVPETTRTNGTVNGITTSTDNVAPATTASVSPQPNQLGWNNSDVTLNLSSADNEGGSGAKEIHYKLTGAETKEAVILGDTAQISIAAEGASALTYWAVDNLGNTEAVKSLEIKIDKTPPVITSAALPQANSHGWNNTDVTISFTATDNLSGVASVNNAVTVAAEGANQNIGGEAVDIAGNKATAYASLNIDKTPPTITAKSSPQANLAGWNNTDVTVTFAGEDALSGIQTITQPVIVAAEWAGQLIAGEAVDFANNKASASLTLNIDKTPPEVLLELKPVNLSEKDEKEDKGNWYKLIYSAQDNLSGLKDLQAGLTVISLSGFKQELEVDEELEIEIDEKKKELKIEAPNPQSVLEGLKDSLFNLNTHQILQRKVKQGERKWKIKEKHQGMEIQAPSCIFKAIASDIAGNQSTKNLEFRE